MFFQRVTPDVSCLQGKKKLEEIRICFSSGMFIGGIANHRKHILYQHENTSKSRLDQYCAA